MPLFYAYLYLLAGALLAGVVTRWWGTPDWSDWLSDIGFVLFIVLWPLIGAVLLGIGAYRVGRWVVGP